MSVCSYVAGGGREKLDGPLTSPAIPPIVSMYEKKTLIEIFFKKKLTPVHLLFERLV